MQQPCSWGLCAQGFPSFQISAGLAESSRMVDMHHLCEHGGKIPSNFPPQNRAVTSGNSTQVSLTVYPSWFSCPLTWVLCSRHTCSPVTDPLNSTSFVTSQGLSWLVLPLSAWDKEPFCLVLYFSLITRICPFVVWSGIIGSFRHMSIWVGKLVQIVFILMQS